MSLNVIAIVVPIFCAVLMGLIGFAFTQSMGRIGDKLHSIQGELTEHKEECDKIDKAVLKAELNNIQADITRFRNVLHWFGNCLMKLGGKLDIDFPDRPTL